MGYEEEGDDAGLIKPLDIMPSTVAAEILEHFLSVHNLLIGHHQPESLRQQLEAFYRPLPDRSLTNPQRRILILILAIAALSTDHCHLGDALFKQCTESRCSGEPLTLQSIEIDLHMISLTWHLREADLLTCKM